MSECSQLENNQFSALHNTNQTAAFCHTFRYGSHSHGDRVCTRSVKAVQTASSQKQQTVFTSTHSHLSPVDCRHVLRITVLLCVQSDTHRRLWNREEQWAKLSADRGVPAFRSWKKYLQYQNNSKIDSEEMECKTVQITGDQRPRWSLISPLSCLCLGLCRQGQYLSNYI